MNAFLGVYRRPRRILQVNRARVQFRRCQDYYRIPKPSNKPTGRFKNRRAKTVYDLSTSPIPRALAICSNFCPYRYTWKSAPQIELHDKDHVLIVERHLSEITDVRTYRGTRLLPPALVNLRHRQCMVLPRHSRKISSKRC